MTKTSPRAVNLPGVATEFVATTLFLFITMTAVTIHSTTVTANWLAIALVFGGAVAVLIGVFTHHSGAHMNPAVTIALWMTKRLDGATAVLYLIAQMAGGALGSFIAIWVLPEEATLQNAAVGLARGVTPVAGLLVEVVLTALLMMVIFAVAVDHRNDNRFAPLAIGLTIMVAVLAGGPLTGAALNPARWFGPALVEGAWSNALLYVAGPSLGAMFGALAYNQFLLPQDEAEQAEAEAAADEEE